MHVFVTGATGFIGSEIVKELISAGHQVTGLARSDANAQALEAAGAAVRRGDLQDLESLKAGAGASEGVIHAGFIHDFSRFAQVCEIDRVAIGALAAGLVGTDHPLIITSGTALVSPGRLATEDIIPVPGASVHPRMSEEAADAAVALGVRAAVVRLSPSVHGRGDHSGFVPMLIKIAREKGVSAYIGEGQNRWTAVHRLDAAKLFRLALEQATPGTRFHGVAEEGVVFKEIAESIGRHLNLPVVSVSPEAAAGNFGWFTSFAGIDCPASSKLTREQLGWQPGQPELLSDLDQGFYFKH